MEKRRLLILVAAFVGVIGATAVAISGQGALTVPETFAGEISPKTKTFGANVVQDEAFGGYFNKSIAADPNCPHTSVGVGAGGDNTDVSFNSGSFAQFTFSDEGTYAIMIGLNGVTSVSMKYSSTEPVSLLAIMLDVNNSLVTPMGEPVVVPAADSETVFNVFPEEERGKKAMSFELSFAGDSGTLTIHSITATWTC